MMNGDVASRYRRAPATVSGVRSGPQRLARSVSVVFVVDNVDGVETPREATRHASTMVVQP
jgi:hypothetical protein